MPANLCIVLMTIPYLFKVFKLCKPKKMIAKNSTRVNE